jgi:dTDP-4-amino-4,6-dideoxygalactose transaminase
MSPTFLPFSLPEIGEEEIAEVVETLRSGWLTTGPKTKQFEAEFAAYIGSDVEALAVNSATAGLHLALEAIGIKPGDEVITTPYTFTATAEVVRYLGANPVFADIDPITRNICPKAIEAKITRNTKAIIPVHFAGLPCDMDAILAIARIHGLKVIEDAAHALPTHYRGRIVGSLRSDATVFSFYATKTITTGEGGMICTRDPVLAQRCKVMRLHGISRDAFDRYTSNAPSWYYEIVAPGFKYNLTDLGSAIGRVQLTKAARFRDKRAHLAQRYSAALGDLPVTLPHDAEADCSHAWHLYVVSLKGAAPLSRDEFIKQMMANGIGCSVHFIPLHLQPYWRDLYKLSPDDFPNALSAYQSAVSLPLYSRMTESEQDRVIDTMRSLLRA